MIANGQIDKCIIAKALIESTELFPRSLGKHYFL